MNGLRTLAGSGLLVMTLGLVGCAGGGDEAGDSGAEPASTEQEAPAGDRSLAAGGTALDTGSTRSSVGEVADRAAPDTRAPAVISTGSLTVESDDVAGARFDLGKVVDALGGSIADEKTTAGEDGEARLSRLVLRIPSEEFDRAMTDLAALGDVTASTRKAEDVTTQVIDTEVRIRAQEQSLRRVEVLLARAQSIQDVVAIEAQLTQRQAELDSLKSQLAWLEDQTSLSTITVYLEAEDEPAPAEQEQDTAAFLAGLDAGWDALTAVAGGLARVAGALLPFAAVALLLGLPAWLVLRRFLARHPVRRPTAEA
ncbi:DUF4349 domain-containing protein [Nocardioides euryhalodurans]|uniref:DUF4349 domain-containing protein n=1 Tax=Nocardioides euryhalodurans TaxID=2518370 RepID=A0A4P7GKK7_9ACTN|nr:DUF4349 domain-containing protein [Nocardioides euryhalodurans]QBR92211.1 DUF4349 domain-containing protein [Nocardioides euryhalodurans]